MQIRACVSTRVLVIKRAKRRARKAGPFASDGSRRTGSAGLQWAPPWRGTQKAPQGGRIYWP